MTIARLPEDITETLATQPTGTGVGCVLRVIDGADRDRQVDINSGIATIGSDPDCQLRLNDASVSRRHVSVEVTGRGLLVVDQASTNGTFYLESRIERAVLSHGAVIRVGRTRIQLASRQPPVGPDYSARDSYGALMGGSPASRRLYAVLERIEKFSDYTVLVLGESGVGKELIAREIHKQSKRAAYPFEVCDCAALPPTLAESHLFGHVRGAFTGAQSNHAGVFERANGGTVLLDEIGELPLDLQPKLLRVLQERTVMPLGAERGKNVDVRVIAATHRDLAAEQKSGRFREDLFFRLKMITVQVPPLRERREDIPALVRTFLKELAPDQPDLTPETMDLFTTGYDWPGNVRELRHAIASTVALGSPPAELEKHSFPVDTTPVDVVASFQEAKRRLVDAFEREYLVTQMQGAESNISQAARASGVERNYFKHLLRKHNLLPGGE